MNYMISLFIGLELKLCAFALCVQVIESRRSDVKAYNTFVA